MAGLRVLAVDDERPALEDLARILESSPQVAQVVLAGSGAEALRTLAERRFDALFLDVRMPDIDGLGVAGLLGQFADPPAVVFVSAYEDGAVGAFELELHALDYLMKPVSRARIGQALERVVADRSSPPPTRAAPAAPEPESAEIIPVAHQRGGATRLVPRSSVLYVKAEGDYVRIVADDGRFLVRGALAELERRWLSHGFVRVHRSYIANLRRAVEIRPELGGSATVVLADGSEVPVARRQVAELRRRLRM
ncbi:MAG: LytTR family DNA-binding domain-containing protein [Actinomycetota bacterium]|nr:LytTR family DNA-binding domain-containing protein [Actinomycetota bacterium]